MSAPSPVKGNREKERAPPANSPQPGIGGVSESFESTGLAGGTQTGSSGPPLTSHGIWVAVRVRPFNKRELQETQDQAKVTGEIGEAVSVVELERDRKTLTLLDPQNGYHERGQYTFDYCFSAFRLAIELEEDKKGGGGDSDDEEELAERQQMDVYRALGQPIVASAWQGYNGCIFAYGQTSSGKTYTMMGTKRDPGVIPRLCKELFERIEDDESTRKMQLELEESKSVAAGPNGTLTVSAADKLGRRTVKVTVSYMEIYNEQVKDLLKTRPKGVRPKFNSRFENNSADAGEYESLRVRQHPLHGPFVEGLTKVDVASWLDCVRIIRQGNEVRSTTETAMNDASSRSHAIFQLIVTQTESLGAKVRGKEVTNTRISKINLVDLAGSERITKSNVTGKHLTEANFINQSLSTLRKVIDVLVQMAKKKLSGNAGGPIVVPYRESLLTWILSDNFGGNSKTAMIANVSPHASCWLETESTLRYATLAKGIVNRIRINEDPSAKLIRELQAQLKTLQSEMSNGPQQGRVRELEDQIEENKHAMEDLISREEGMRKLIQESRIREAKLRSEKESLEAAHVHWKQEAERLSQEKEELKRQLSKLAEQGGPRGQVAAETLEKNRRQSEVKKSFWITNDAESSPDGSAKASAEPSSTSGGAAGGSDGLDPTDPVQKDEEVICPPQSHRPPRPTSSKPAVTETVISTSPSKPAEDADDEPAFLKDDATGGSSSTRTQNSNKNSKDSTTPSSTTRGGGAGNSPPLPLAPVQENGNKSSAATSQHSLSARRVNNQSPKEDLPQLASSASTIDLAQRADSRGGGVNNGGSSNPSNSSFGGQGAGVTPGGSSNSNVRNTPPSGDLPPREDSTVSPSVRYGRRAVTEEGKEREAVKPAEVRTAEQRPRRGRNGDGSTDGPTPAATSAVPLSLQHLVGPGGASASAPQLPANRNSAGPDALDAFLSGETEESQKTVAERKRDRAVPPWRQKRN